MTLFAFSLYFRLLGYPPIIRHFLLFNSQFSVASLTNISKKKFFLTLPEGCRYASKLFLQNIHYFFILLFKKGAGAPYRRVPSQKNLDKCVARSQLRRTSQSLLSSGRSSLLSIDAEIAVHYEKIIELYSTFNCS